LLMYTQQLMPQHGPPCAYWTEWVCETICLMELKKITPRRVSGWRVHMEDVPQCLRMVQGKALSTSVSHGYCWWTHQPLKPSLYHFFESCPSQIIGTNSHMASPHLAHGSPLAILLPTDT
jgi:hypothetical protein